MNVFQWAWLRLFCSKGRNHDWMMYRDFCLNCGVSKHWRGRKS